MPVKSTIDPSSDVIVHAVVGNLDLDEVVSALDRIVNHPLFRPGLNVLWDFSGASSANLDAQELRNLVRQVRERLDGRGEGYKTALVAPRDVDYGLARMYEAHASELPVDLRVFRGTGEAWDWLLGRAHPQSQR